MPERTWKDALWKLLDGLTFPRLTRRVALSASLLSLTAQAAPGTETRVPVSPALEPQAAVRRFKGRYVLKRIGNAFAMRLAGHASHSSHASHASHSSHSSHSSSSHYSGAHASHYSSSAPPPSLPVTPPPSPPPEPPPPAVRSLPRSVEPPPILAERFDDAHVAERWRIGVLATTPDTFDRAIAIAQSDGLLTITPREHEVGSHFSGYVSTGTFDLRAVSVAVQIRRAAPEAATIFAAAIDAGSWVGFRIEGGQLTIESHSGGLVAAKKQPYSATEHRHLRVRTSSVAPVVFWETSADGRSWKPEYVETSSISLDALHIVLTAGTTKARTRSGSAAFTGVTVERKP